MVKPCKKPWRHLDYTLGDTQGGNPINVATAGNAGWGSPRNPSIFPRFSLVDTVKTQDFLGDFMLVVGIIWFTH